MEPQSERAFPLRKAYPFAEEHGMAEEVRKIRDMEISWDRPYTSSVRRGFIIDLFQRHGLLATFKVKHWPYGLTKGGEAEERRYLRIKFEFDTITNPPLEEAQSTPVEVTRKDEEFVLESHLRDFLAKNPERIEPGLRLFSTPESEGVEFLVDKGRIDILTVDPNGKFVVIELKVSRGRSKALGQLLYYMGWVDKNLGNGPCRGIIIAKNITEDLVTAVSRVSEVTLYRYRMSFSVEEVSATTAT